MNLILARSFLEIQFILVFLGKIIITFTYPIIVRLKFHSFCNLHEHIMILEEKRLDSVWQLTFHSRMDCVIQILYVFPSLLVLRGKVF